MFKYLLILILCLLISAGAFAQDTQRDPAQESPFIEELKASAPGSVDKFVAATKALDAGNYSEADQLYKEVLAVVPDFDPALRRDAYALAEMGKRDLALGLTERALAHTRSVDNLVGRASTLLTYPNETDRPTEAEASEALELAREAWSKSDGSDLGAGTLLAQTLLQNQKYEEFETFAHQLKMKFPDSPGPIYFNALALAETEQFRAAEAELDRLGELGVPKETTDPIRAAIQNARDEQFFGLGRYRSVGYAVAGAILLWAVGLLLLFVCGRALSAKTLRSVETSDPNDIAGANHSRLRRIYRFLISIAGVYYYISQPFVIFLIIAIAAGLILAFLAGGTVPIKLVLIIAFVSGASVFYMIKSLIIRTKPEDPGRMLAEDEAPGLWQLTRDVASTITTRPVNEIRITHGTELAVYERGTFRSRMSDSAERILIIGTAVLKGFEKNAFRAVLAHEYGHFSNRDTAGGDIAFRVNSDILRTAAAMGEAGTATFYNFGFQFLRLFHFLFRRITLGASRLQEVLADRVAAYHFGPEAFKDGLDHVIRSEIEFGHLANNEISAALNSGRAFQNFYEMSVQDENAMTTIESEMKSAVDRDTTADDSHPSPRDRYRFIEKIRPAEVEYLHGEVWDLFADPSKIKAEMTDVIERLVRGRGSSGDSGILNLE